MKDNSGINWHNDHNYKYGITYYINRRWNPRFGGEFLFKCKNANGFIPFVGNESFSSKKNYTNFFTTR